MASIGRRLKISAAMIALSMAAALGGCSDGGGVEVGGKLLDTLGVSTAALSSNKTGDPKMAQRSPLVMPPSTQKLPEPGAAPPPPPDLAAGPAWPKDPDQERAAAGKEKQRQQAAYCRDGNWKERAVDNDLGGQKGPQGNCGTIFSFVGDFFGGSTPATDPMNGGGR